MELVVTQARNTLNRDITGDYDEARIFYESIQELLTIFLQWWQRVDALILQSRKILPIGLRRQAVDIKRPAKMLVNYETEDVSGSYSFCLPS